MTDKRMAHRLTPKQWREATRRRIMKEEGLSAADADLCPEIANYEMHWIEELRQAASAGEPISRVCLDRLAQLREDEAPFHQFARDYPQAIPSTYRTPKARARTSWDVGFRADPSQDKDTD